LTGPKKNDRKEKKMAIDIETYYQRYKTMILNRCRALVSDEQKAFDILQDTFVQLARHQNRLEDHAPITLMYRIATNLCLNHLRQEKRFHRMMEALRLDTGARNEESRMIARDALSRLFREREKCAPSLTLAVNRYVNGMTLGELAEEMNMSQSGIRKRLCRLRSDLVVVNR
jgi:RNA polymerase sigma-70 factor, ECF subfamily